ncbi:YbaK/EbsC family protein [Actinoalloteichus spitiensis]|uniref:YbaK/EbsC family protein n=1 Tax=Actinoalloteichus spitiensis TaxID=252394 RepID=UPI0003674568|nr:YbaK/EbsC family protein [Actinoalloteichus spitiensis]
MVAVNSVTHPGVLTVVELLRSTGMSGCADGLRFLDADVRTAAQAAAQVGVEVGAIANSLVFDADGAPLLVMTSGAHRADVAVLARLVGATRVRRATPEFVRHHTGQAIGGVAPVGHPTRIATLVDTALRRHPVVWAAAGHPRSLFPLTVDQLVTVTGGREVSVTEVSAPPTPEQEDAPR